MNKVIKRRNISDNLILDETQIYKEIVLGALAIALDKWETEHGYSHTQYPDTEYIIDEAECEVYDILKHGPDVQSIVSNEIKHQWYELGTDSIRTADINLYELTKTLEEIYKLEGAA